MPKQQQQQLQQQPAAFAVVDAPARSISVYIAICAAVAEWAEPQLRLSFLSTWPALFAAASLVQAKTPFQAEVRMSNILTMAFKTVKEPALTHTQAHKHIYTHCNSWAYLCAGH